MTRILMGPIVETMRWMTRYMSPIARPIVRWVADREVIACGLRGNDGTVRIIYSPQAGESDYRVVYRSDSGWIASDYTAAGDFAPGLVRQVMVPDARIDSRYRVLARRTNGRPLSSPAIRIKSETRRLSTLSVRFDRNGGAQICWPRAARSMVYFLTVQKQGDPTLVGIYTREQCWRYPLVSTASLTIGGSDLPQFVPHSEYLIQLAAVDYDGWVATLSTWNGICEA